VTDEERYRKTLEELEKLLPELQKCVHGCADQKVRDDTFHAVIELRRLVRVALHPEHAPKEA
jgi:hypothetical protein